MGDHLLDGGESKNFESFQEYPSFDNGILDIGVMDSGSMNTETINPGIGDPATINPGIGDPATINSGTVNSEFVNPATVNSGTVNSEFVNPGTVNSEFVNPGTVDSGIMQSRAINSETINTEIPVQQSFDPGIPETSNNYEKAIVPGTIDSRSFTHTEAEWQRIQAGEPTVNYVDATDSWDNYREDKTQSFFRTLLAFFVSIIVAGVFVLINVKFYDINHISTLQCMLSMLPPLMMFCSFYFITGKKELMVVEGVLLIVLNEILSYIMFHSVMAHNVQKIYPEFSFQEAWKFVEVMKSFPETQRIYYLHFVIIFGIASVIGIIIGSTAFEGLFGRRRRY